MSLTDRLDINFLWEYAGLITISLMTYKNDSISYHLFPSKDQQQWGFGYDECYYFPSFGLGPLLLICWTGWEEYST